MPFLRASALAVSGPDCRPRGIREDSRYLFIPEYVWLATDQSRVRNLACKSSFFSLSQAGSFQALPGIRIESIYV